MPELRLYGHGHGNNQRVGSLYSEEDKNQPLKSDGVSTGRRVLKNYFVLTFAQIVIALLSFVATAYIARVLTAKGFGVIGFCAATVTYMLLLVDMGFNYYCVRETSRDPSLIPRFMNNVVAMRASLAAAGYAVLILFAMLSSRPPVVRAVLLIMGIKVVGTVFDFRWVFQAREKMGWIALSRLLPQALYVAAIFIVVRDPSHIYRYSALQVLAAAGTAMILIYLYLKMEGTFRFSFDSAFWKAAFKQSFPMAAIYLLNQINVSFDMVLLGFTHGEETVGFYNAAYKVILMLNLLGIYYFSSLYPNLSRIYNESVDRLRSILEFSIRQIGIIVIPLAVGGTLLAGPLVRTVFGENYAASVLPLRILIWSVPMIHMRQHFSHALIAAGEQNRYMYGAILGAASNIILNIIFVPKYGMKAAAVTTLVSEAAVFIFLYLCMPSVTPVSFIGSIPRPLAAAAVMGMAIYFTPPWNVFIKIAFGIAVYLPALYAVGGVKREDLRKLGDVLKGKNGR